MSHLTHIFLFGHRKQTGKDFSCNLLKSILSEKNIFTKQSYFAKTLKQQIADRYGLDFNKMNDDEYKKSKPPHLNGLTVRDVLIKEGCFARSIWQNTWAFPMYKDLLTEPENGDSYSSCSYNKEIRVGLCSDFRFPNEYSCFDECFNLIDVYKTLSKPKVIKVLVHRPDGIFVNDGADDQLPDIDSYWDYRIMNDDKTANWKNNIADQLKNMIKYYLE